jgi:GTP-binding protein Era
MAETKPRTHVIALAGATNAGKSTLLNALVGSKVSIVTPKVQTTRARVTGITMVEDTQLIFVDTPGIFKPEKRLDKAMVKAAWNGIDSADTIVLLCDATRIHHKDYDMIFKGIAQRTEREECNAVLILNKIDKVKKEDLLALVANLNRDNIFEKTFLISALKGDGIEDLRDFFTATAKDSPWLYDPEQITDLPMRQLAAEITREKLFLQLRQELPYNLTVETDTWEETAADKKLPKGSVKINQTIFVTREGHKKIILGVKGAGIKRVGEQARKDLSRILDLPVHLFLFVKVRENWQDSESFYTSMGLDFPS